MTRLRLAVVSTFAILGACAARRAYGAFASELDARSLASSFGCDPSTFPAEYKAHAHEPVPVGAPFCLVLARFGDPTYAGMTDALSSGVVRVRYPVKGMVYRATGQRDRADMHRWSVTASALGKR